MKERSPFPQRQGSMQPVHNSSLPSPTTASAASQGLEQGAKQAKALRDIAEAHKACAAANKKLASLLLGFQTENRTEMSQEPVIVPAAVDFAHTESVGGLCKAS